MPPIDSRSIIFFAIFTSIFFWVVLFILHHSFPKAIRGLEQWSAACAFAAVAAALLYANDFIPRFLSIVMGNTLVAVFQLLMFESLRRFNGRTSRAGTLLAVIAVLAALRIWIAYGANYEKWGILLSSCTSMLLFGACAVVTAQISQDYAAKRFTFATFVLAGLVSCIRFVTVVAQVDIPTHLFDASMVHKVYLASYPLSTLAATLGFVMLANENLRNILRDSNRTLEEAVAQRTADLRLEIKRTKELEWLNATVAENERSRIGRELHDDLGQKMTGISLSAEALAFALQDVSPNLAAQADGIERAASAAIAKVRDISHGLMPVEPGASGLRDALAQLAASVSTLSSIACSFDYDDPVDVEDASVATNLFRIAQESLSNAIRHSRASQVLLHMDYIDGKVSLSIADNGVGFEAGNTSSQPVAQEGGSGLSIMEYRAFVIGYTLAIESAPGLGTTVRVTQR